MNTAQINRTVLRTHSWPAVGLHTDRFTNFHTHKFDILHTLALKLKRLIIIVNFITEIVAIIWSIKKHFLNEQHFALTLTNLTVISLLQTIFIQNLQGQSEK